MRACRKEKCSANNNLLTNLPKSVKIKFMYDESMAEQAKQWIRESFQPMLRECIATLRERAEQP